MKFILMDIFVIVIGVFFQNMININVKNINGALLKIDFKTH